LWLEYAHEYSQRRHRIHPAFPAQWFYGLYVISPGTGLFCPRRSRGNCSLRKLSASVGAPGPHDFAVRSSAARLASPKRPPHPTPNVRDDRDTPLLWRRDGRKNTQFPIFRKRNISACRTENPNQLESAREIRFYAHAIFRPERPSREATSSKIRLSRPSSGKSLGPTR